MRGTVAKRLRKEAATVPVLVQEYDIAFPEKYPPETHNFMRGTYRRGFHEHPDDLEKPRMLRRLLYHPVLVVAKKGTYRSLYNQLKRRYKYVKRTSNI